VGRVVPESFRRSLSVVPLFRSSSRIERTLWEGSDLGRSYSVHGKIYTFVILVFVDE
jgi:hypothetical protein